MDFRCTVPALTAKSELFFLMIIWCGPHREFVSLRPYKREWNCDKLPLAPCTAISIARRESQP